jgi:hypothetical protein
MTDRQAAETAGLNPDSAAYTKSKPHVRAYMLEHRAAVQRQLVQQEADGLHRFNLDREQVLGRLWELAKLSPEMTRGSITGQVKALSLIIAMQNFIPDRKALSEKNPPAPPAKPKIYEAAWLRKQQDTTMEPPVPVQEEAAPDLSSRPERSAVEGPAVPTPTFADRFSASQALPRAPYVPVPASVPETRGPFSMKMNPFVRRR